MMRVSSDHTLPKHRRWQQRASAASAAAWRRHGGGGSVSGSAVKDAEWHVKGGECVRTHPNQQRRGGSDRDTTRQQGEEGEEGQG